MRMDSRDQQTAFIRQFSFASVITTNLEATHVPLWYAPDEGEMGTLYGHLAKQNPQLKQFNRQSVLAIFQGPHSYISHMAYASSPQVPTWNYAAVHCKGVAQLLDNNDTVEVIDNLMKQFEPVNYPNPSRMPQTYADKLLTGITGFKIEVTEIQGKEKLGQHKPVEDQQAVHAYLQQSKCGIDRDLAAYMQQRNLGLGSL